MPPVPRWVLLERGGERAAVDVDEIAVGAARAAHDRPTETALLIIFTRQSDMDNGRKKYKSYVLKLVLYLSLE